MSLLKDFPILQRNISNIRLNSSCHFSTYCASLEGHKKEALRSGPALNENCFAQHQISRLMQEKSSAGSAQQRAMGYIDSELLHSPWKMAELVTACSLKSRHHLPHVQLHAVLPNPRQEGRGKKQDWAGEVRSQCFMGYSHSWMLASVFLKGFNIFFYSLPAFFFFFLFFLDLQTES